MEEVFLQINRILNRVEWKQLLVSILLSGCLCATFYQFPISDFSFSTHALTLIIFLTISIVLTLSFFLKNKKKISFTLSDLFLLSFFVYYIIRYDFNEQLANWRIILWLDILILWVLIKWLRHNGLLTSECISWVIVASGCLQAIWGLLQLYNFCPSNHVRYDMTGSFLNPGPFTGYISVAFPVAFHLYLKNKDCKQWLALTAMAIMFIILPAGMSRSAWIGTIVASCFVLFQQKGLKKYWYTAKRGSTITILLLVIVGIIGGVFMFNLKKDSAYGRLFIWGNTCTSIAKRPVTGYGSCSFSEVYASSQSEKFLSGNYSEREEKVAGNPEYAFNEYLQIWMEGGLIMLLLFIGLVFICMKQSLYHKQYGLCGGLISFLCFAFSSYPFQYPSFWTVLCFLLAGMATIQSKPQIYSDNLSLPILFVSSVCVFLSLSSPYKQIEIWGKCRILYPKGETALAINGYKLLYPSLKHSPKFIFEYAQYLSGNKEYEISNALYERYLKLQCNSLIYNFIGDNYLKLSQFQLAEKYYKKSINFLPNRIYPYYLLAKLYAEPQFRQPEKFKKMADKVLHKKPKVHSKAIEKMREEIKNIAKERHLPI